MRGKESEDPEMTTTSVETEKPSELRVGTSNEVCPNSFYCQFRSGKKEDEPPELSFPFPTEEPCSERGKMKRWGNKFEEDEKEEVLCLKQLS